MADSGDSKISKTLLAVLLLLPFVLSDFTLSFSRSSPRSFTPQALRLLVATSVTKPNAARSYT
jgi:hypothetical protein